MNGIEINSRFILKLILWAIILWLLYITYDILLLLFISYIIMAALYPAVKRLEENNVPRWFGIIAIFVAFLLTIGIIIAVTLPPLVTQTQMFVASLPDLVNKVINTIDVRGYLDRTEVVQYVRELLIALSREFGGAPASIIRVGAGIINNFVATIMVFVFSFYLIMEREKVHRVLVALVPYSDKKKLNRFLEKVDAKLGDWMRGQLLLMLIIGLASLVGLLILGVPFAIPLALIAGTLELVPIVGPILAAIPAIMVALAVSPIKALAVIVLYILIQQLEGSLVVPRVMKKAVGLDPLVVILAIMVGARIAGPLGALLAIPTAAILMIFVTEWSKT